MTTAELEMTFEETVPAVTSWSPDAAATLARATWIARCARRLAELARDVELEQARAVAEQLSNDETLRADAPERVAERMVRCR